MARSHATNGQEPVTAAARAHGADLADVSNAVILNPIPRDGDQTYDIRWSDDAAFAGAGTAVAHEIANFQCTMIGGAPTYSSALQSICEREWFIDCDARVEELVSRVCRKFGWPLAPAPLVHANVNQRERYLVKYSASHIAAALKDINHEDSRLYALFDPGEELARRRGTPKKAPRHVHASPLPKRECCPAPAAIMSDAIRGA
jgi:hypothetical protein